MRWCCAVPAAAVPVPEAAMNENNSLVPRQNYVRPPGQAFPVQPEPVAHPVQQRSNNHFRLGVLAPDTAHVPTSVLYA